MAGEQGWNHTEAIDSLLRKGGFKGPITDEVRRTIELTKYQSEKLTRSFNDWQRSQQQR